MSSSLSKLTFHDLVLHLSQHTRDGGANVYLLLDQSGMPAFKGLWHNLKGVPWTALLGSQTTQPDGGSPLLFDVSSACSSRALQRTLKHLHEQGRFANCLSLLCSTLGLERLGAGLRERAAAELPDGLRVILRFFDSRTLPLLPRLLTDTQYGAFMSCVESWYGVDRRGEMQLMPQASQGANEAAPFPWRLDRSQERLLMEDGLTDGVIDQLLTHRHPAIRLLNPAEQFELVSPLVASARNYLVDDVLEATEFCFAALEHGADFHLQEPWRTRLKAYCGGHVELRMALAHA